MTLKLFNTLGRKKDDFKPIDKGQARMYTCGPTVYNFPHIGNLRAMLFADTLYRWLKFGEQLSVKWVMNITDVDDKTIRDSQAEFKDLDSMEALQRFTRKYEDIFFDDLNALNIQKDSFSSNPRATEFIKQMQELVTYIYKNGFARIVDGSVFFYVAKYSNEKKYGVLLNLNLDNLKTGTRSLADEIEKENVQDFALWKARKDGEPYWDFQLDGQDLPGRPGWHIECSAMSSDLLGLPFDIHTGGIDLIFPHHEDEIAQAEAGWDLKTANYWIHNDHLFVDNRKMSKSLGNFYTLRDLLDKGHTSESIRFFLVSNHYRQKLNLSDEALQAAHNALQKIRNSLDLAQKRSDENADDSAVKLLLDEFNSAMRDDLNTPQATAVLFKALSTDNLKKEDLFDFFKYAESIYGVRFLPGDAKIPDNIIGMARKRQEAKSAKDYAEADKLRNQIAAAGYEVRDSGDSFEILPQEK